MATTSMVTAAEAVRRTGKSALALETGLVDLVQFAGERVPGELPTVAVIGSGTF